MRDRYSLISWAGLQEFPCWDTLMICWPIKFYLFLWCWILLPYSVQNRMWYQSCISVSVSLSLQLTQHWLIWACEYWFCVSSQLHAQWCHSGSWKCAILRVSVPWKLTNTINEGFFFSFRVYLPVHHCLYSLVLAIIFWIFTIPCM